MRLFTLYFKLNHFHLEDERFSNQLEVGNHSKEIFASLSGLLPSK